MKTENMTFSEALEAMKQGYKIKRMCWIDSYIYLKNNEIVTIVNNNEFKGVNIDNILDTDWEIYNEPKPEPQFEIGELVMMRDKDNEQWFPRHFARVGAEGFYQSMGGSYKKQCAKFDKDIVFTNKPVKK